MRADAPGAALRVLVCLSALLAFLGLTTYPLGSGGFVRALADHPPSLAATGLERGSALKAAELVRGFVMGSVDSLPAQVDGRSGFDRRAVRHLEDVRTVLAGGRRVAWTALAVLCGCLIAARVWGRTAQAASGLRACAAALAVAVVLAAAVGVSSPEWAFARFHDLMFAPGTWLFPADDLLVLLFPGRFWALSGAAWGSLCLAGGGALWALTRFHRR